jgi:hypothetical protein
MKVGSIVAGILLLAVAVWILVTMDNVTARYLGGAVLGVLGIALFFAGFRAEKAS